MDQVNIYDIFGYCYPTSPDEALLHSLYGENNRGLAVVGQELKTYKKFWTASDYTPWVPRKSYNESSEENLRGLPPCTWGGPIIKYLNDKAVRKALHIPDKI